MHSASLLADAVIYAGKHKGSSDKADVFISILTDLLGDNATCSAGDSHG